MGWLLGLLGGGVQPEGQKSSGAAGQLINQALSSSQANAKGKSDTQKSVSSNMDLPQNYNNNPQAAPIKGRPMDSGFYKHMTVSKARKGRDVKIMGTGC